MLIEMNKPAFVYVWTDWVRNMLYLGVHKGATDDGYVCSSTFMMEEYNTRPDDFTRQIVAQGPVAEMRKFEATLLQTVRAAQDPHYYNKNNSVLPDNTGRPCSEKTRKKISDANTGKTKGVPRPRSEASIRKQSATMKGLGKGKLNNNWGNGDGSRGEKNGRWKGGVSYDMTEYNRIARRKRGMLTNERIHYCAVCGKGPMIGSMFTRWHGKCGET